MSINREQVIHIAHLARIKIDPAQADFYAGQLTRILDLVGQMNRIDTAGVAPMSHPSETPLRLREDSATAAETETQRDEYQRIAPATQRGLYLAPKVIE